MAHRIGVKMKKFKEIITKQYEFDRWMSVMLLLFAFVFSGIFGFLYEEIFYRIDLGEFVKRGTTAGPWIPIYGFGGIIILLITTKINRKPLLIFLISVLASGIVEFGTGYVLYHYMGGLRLWDYNVEIWNWGNIGGYVCARSVLFFGVSGVALVCVIMPFVSNMAEKVNRKVFSGVFITLAALFVLDIIFSSVLHII